MDYYAMREQLLKIIGDFDAPYQYWLGGDDTDQGLSYCLPCAAKKVAAGEAEFVDGGWGQESDGCSSCDTCHRLLEYTLTNYGAESEKQHYTENPPDSLDQRTAFCLLNLLDAASSDEDVHAIVLRALNAKPQ